MDSDDTPGNIFRIASGFIVSTIHIIVLTDADLIQVIRIRNDEHDQCFLMVLETNIFCFRGFAIFEKHLSSRHFEVRLK